MVKQVLDYERVSLFFARVLNRIDGEVEIALNCIITFLYGGLGWTF